jgi:hypothetical protein
LPHLSVKSDVFYLGFFQSHLDKVQAHPPA